MGKRRPRQHPPPRPRPSSASTGRGWAWALSQTSVIAALVFIVLFLLAQPAFRPKDIAVSGAQRVSAAEVVAALALDRDRSIFLANRAQLEQRVDTLPWVRSSDVRLLLPNRVEVQITEWAPVAVLQVGELSYYLNERGAVLGPAAEAGRLVVLDRPDIGTPKTGDTVVPGALVRMLVPLQAGFYPAFKVRVASFELDANQVLTLRTQRGWTVIFGQMVTADDRASLEPKLAALRALSANLDLTSAPIVYINLMNPRAPAVQLRPR